MRKTVNLTESARLVLLDSMSEIRPDDVSTVVVAGSHAGVNVAAYALRYPLRAAFFNDAGVGKDDAGIVSLGILENEGVPAGTVAHTSACIGNAADAYTNGVLSHVNQAAEDLGIRVGDHLSEVIVRCFGDQRSDITE